MPFVAAKHSLLLVDIEMRVVSGGHESLALIWVTEVPVPDAIDDSKDLGVFPISKHISFGDTTLVRPATRAPSPP